MLLLASTRAYNTEDFVAAAKRLGIVLDIGTDRCHMLAELWPEGTLALNFRDPEEAAEIILAHARTYPLAGILPTDETTAIIAGRAGEMLGLDMGNATAAYAAGNKLLFRQRMRAAGLPQPGFTPVPIDTGAVAAERAMADAGIHYPVVIKPLHMSASRGVMRADTTAELAERLARMRALFAADPEAGARRPEAAETVLIESFVPGAEVAFEGLLRKDRSRDTATLHSLAIFDKPDPLEGPFFAETIYVTPSEHPPAVQEAILHAVRAAAAVIGLQSGPVHAELRLPDGGAPVVIELAARAIGGLCGRTLRFGVGISLEELLLLHAAGRDVSSLARRVGGAAGVYMLPVPQAGVLREIHGTQAAADVAGMRSVVITARPGEDMIPLPEGNRYMGFLFAEGKDPGEVTEALRRAAAAISFHIVPKL